MTAAARRYSSHETHTMQQGVHLCKVSSPQIAVHWDATIISLLAEVHRQDLWSLLFASLEAPCRQAACLVLCFESTARHY